MNILFNSDCYNQIEKLIEQGIKVDCIITDPPYDISTTNRGGTINKVKKLNESLKEINLAKIDKGYDIEKFNSLFLKIMKNVNIYVFCNKIQIPEYFDFYVMKLKCKFDIICWHKTNALPTYSNKYLSDTEYCLHFKKGASVHPESYEDAKTYYIAPINHKDKKEYNHPTIKPLDLIEKFVRNSTKKDDLILDPFMGSGTTGVACKKLNRDFIGIELNKEYYNIAKERIENEQRICF